MDTATKILSSEHQNILKISDVLLKECDALESGKELDKNFFAKAVDFIKNYADKFHHAREEDILFAELRKDTAQMHCNPIPQMLFEHDLGRNLVKDLEEGINENNNEKIVKNARGYAQLIREHIFKEDNILYPMIDGALSAETQKSILDKFKQAETKFGFKIKQFLFLVEEFEKRK